MDPAILSATSGLVGSLIGGVSTFVASWLTQRAQIRTHTLLQQAVKREALYAEFIVEASKRFADAWSHHAETLEVISGLHSAVARMRLTSSDAVIRAAEQVIQSLVESYAAPDRTFDELRQNLKVGETFDPLLGFSTVCRAELGALRN